MRDTSTDKAAAALCVGVGAHADTDIAGLAHFLEHMLFQGTETYRQDNAYKQYVARRAGSTNASTSGEQTCFQFDVVDEAFGGALDRFARFFREPLLLESCVDREMHAVDAEHSKNLNDDGRRAYQVLRKSANQGHNFKNFSNVCIETLKVTQIRERLLSFWRDRYDPENMTECLVSSRSLDVLEVLLAENFSGIRRAPDASNACERLRLFAATGIVHEQARARPAELRIVAAAVWFGTTIGTARSAVGDALGATLRHCSLRPDAVPSRETPSKRHTPQATRANSLLAKLT